jgi:murein L,D-transpeptidase YafK
LYPLSHRPGARHVKKAGAGRIRAAHAWRAACLVFMCAVLLAEHGCANERNQAVRKAFASWEGPYALFVSKAEFTMYVYGRGLDVVERYKVAVGLNPDSMAKLCADDDRTPEGEYKILEIWSMDAAPDSPSYRKMARYNQIYFRAKDGHYRYGQPSADLGDNVYGPRFYLLDYPNERDRERYETALRDGKIPAVRGKPSLIGHGIAIHGNNDEASIGHNATSGCVRMYNRDIVQLERYIQVGTPVIISAR